MIAASRLALTAGVAYFLIANTFGLLLGAGAIGAHWRPAHAHLALLGFVAMTIYGVAYHALPRFRGAPFRRPRLALSQVLLANVGLVGMVLTWGLGFDAATFAIWGGVSWLASALFVVLILEVLWGPRPGDGPRRHRR